MKIEKTIHQNLLKVKIVLPKAEYINEQKVKITTEQVREMAKDEEQYQILSVIKHGRPVKNFLKNDKDTNQSTWIFLISRKDIPKKTGRKASIRGRMSKIAKEKTGK